MFHVILYVVLLGHPQAPFVTGCCMQRSGPISSDFATCSILSNNEIAIHWSSLYSINNHVENYRVVYDGEFAAPECLTNQFSNPNNTCIFSGLNSSLNYTFSVSAVNCIVQESSRTNFTISLG